MSHTDSKWDKKVEKIKGLGWSGVVEVKELIREVEKQTEARMIAELDQLWADNHEETVSFEEEFIKWLDDQVEKQKDLDPLT